MAFKQERPGFWYDRAAVGDAIFKIVWDGSSEPVKAVTAAGVRTQISSTDAAVLISSVACAVVQKDATTCGRDLPCRYHS
jgi:hypothetical protein